MVDDENVLAKTTASCVGTVGRRNVPMRACPGGLVIDEEDVLLMC
jgi:hypothetical protein